MLPATAGQVLLRLQPHPYPQPGDDQMATVQHLLNQKGFSVYSIHPDATVFDAIAKMAEHDIGSLLVMDRDKLVGIFSERDYARNVILKGRSSPTTPVREIMEPRVVCVQPEQTVEECMALMTDKRVRHLPVLEGQKVTGIVSIGDLVKSIISDQKFIIEQLEHYIHHWCFCALLGQFKCRPCGTFFGAPATPCLEFRLMRERATSQRIWFAMFWSMRAKSTFKRSESCVIA
jgi:CBS domain-containing protein